MADIEIIDLFNTLQPARKALAGPFWKSTSVGYVFTQTIPDSGGSTYSLRVYKTTDSGTTWTEQDSADAPTHATDQQMGFDAKWDGTKIHLSYVGSGDNVASAGSVYYNHFNTSTDQWGTQITVASSLTVAGSTTSHTGIVLADGGNIYIEYNANTGATMHGFYRSTDGGGSFSSRTDPYDSGTHADRMLLTAGEAADNQDIIGIYYDQSAGIIYRTLYDNSANNWSSRTSIATVTTDLSFSVTAGLWDVVKDEFNGGSVVAFWNDDDDVSTNDLLCYRITESTITALGNIVSNADDCYGVALLVNNNNGDLYAAYLGTDAGTGTWTSLVNCYFKVSTDDGASWSAEQTYGTENDDQRLVSLGSWVGTGGGRCMPVWFNDDTGAILVNDSNDVEIAAAGTTHNAAAALSVAVTVAGAATNTKVAAAALSVAVTVAAAAKLTAGGAAALSAAVTLASTAKLTAGGAAALSVAVTTSPAPRVTYAAAAAHNVVVTVVVVGGISLSGAATLPVTVTLSATPGNILTAAAALAISVVVAPTARATYSAQGVLSTTVSLAANARAIYAASATLAAAVSLSASATNTKVAQAALSVVVSLSALGSLTQIGAAALSASVTLSAAPKLTLGASAAVNVTTTLAAAPKATWGAASLLAVAVTVAPNGGNTKAAAAVLAVVVSLSAIGSLRIIPDEKRVWAILYDGSDIATAFWPYIISGRTSEAVNQIGVWQCRIPASQSMQDLMGYGRRLDLYYEPEGATPIMRGRIKSWTLSDSDEGALLDVDGWSLAVELLWGNTGYAIYSIGDTASNVMSNIVARAETTWTRLISGSGFVTFSNDYPPMNLWRASLLTAQIQGGYLRETYTSRQLELKRGTTASGVRLVNSEQQLMIKRSDAGLINGLPSVKKDGGIIVNRIYPFGQAPQGEPFNLQRSTRSSPYTIQIEQGPVPRVVQALPATVISAEGFEATFQSEGDNRYCVAYIVSNGGSSADIATIGGQQMTNLGIGQTVGVVESVVWAGKPPKGSPALKMDTPLSGGPSAALIVSLKGVDQVSPIRDTSATNGSGTSVSITVDTEVGDYILCWLTLRNIYADPNPTITPGSGVSLVEDFLDTGSFSRNQLTVWTKTAAATSTTLSWTLGTSSDYDVYAVSLKPANLYYIEDSTSVTANKRRVKDMVMNSFRPADPTDMVAASNTLYDRAVTEMLALKDGIKDYNLDVVDLPTPTTWLPGDSLATIYAGRALGDEQVLNINNEALICLKRDRSWASNQPMKWSLKLTNVYRFPNGLAEVLYGNEERLSDLER